MNNETLDPIYVLETFKIMAQSFRVPIKRANLMRRAMLMTVNEGVKPTTYRYEFMRSKVGHLVAEVNKILSEFNSKYPDDVMIFDDIGDILSSVKSAFKNSL